MTGQEQIFNMLLNEDEVTWQSIIYDLVKSGEVNPWDVDVTALSTKYLEMIRKLKEHDFRVSGKVLLAATLLLKIKSDRLLGADMTDFDNLLRPVEEDTFEELYESGDLDEHLAQLEQEVEKPTLIPRTPQPRERKVTIFDLVDALNQALSTQQRRVTRDISTVEIKAPEKTKDITEVIREVYQNITAYFSKEKDGTLDFDTLSPSQEKEDRVFTFIPLLHLTNQGKIDLLQKGHFSPIHIKMLKK